jgi:hypothetical protein
VLARLASGMHSTSSTVAALRQAKADQKLIGAVRSMIE